MVSNNNTQTKYPTALNLAFILLFNLREKCVCAINSGTLYRWHFVCTYIMALWHYPELL